VCLLFVLNPELTVNGICCIRQYFDISKLQFAIKTVDSKNWLNSCNIIIRSVNDAVPFIELVQYGRTLSIFSIWYCRCQWTDLTGILERVFWPTLALYMIMPFIRGLFLPKYVELFEPVLKIWSFLWMVP